MVKPLKYFIIQSACEIMLSNIMLNIQFHTNEISLDRRWHNNHAVGCNLLRQPILSRYLKVFYRGLYCVFNMQ